MDGRTLVLPGSLVLVLGGPEEPEVARVLEEISARRGRALVVDTSRFPEQRTITLENGLLVWEGKKVPVPRAVYVRSMACHPLAPAFKQELEARPRGLVAQLGETRGLLESVLLSLAARGTRLVNPPDVNTQHSRKPYQLDLLQRAGLPVPRWLATNDPASVRRFARQVGRCVYKPIAGGASVRLVEENDLTDERLESLAAAPVLFQEYVPGTPVRAYVVGRRVPAAAEIISPEIDYRRQEDAVIPTALSREERAAALAATRACGMQFTGVDLIRMPKGFRVLECNPSPMFGVFEEKTGLDVAGPLAELLLST